MRRRVERITRYPVKSMGGESLPKAFLGLDGLPGDRAWALRDSVRGDLFLGKRNGKVMECSARYPEGDVPRDGAPEVHLPDGVTFRASDETAAERLGGFLGQTVSLESAEAERHSPAVYSDEEMRAMLARDPGDPLPDFSDTLEEVARYQTRGMPHFDAFPLLLLTTRSLESLQAAAPESVVDERRFRPNFLIDVDSEDRYPEFEWVGKRFGLGEARIAVHAPCIRCAMTTHGFSDLPKDPRLMRTLVEQTEAFLGVYATIETPGEVRVGSELRRVFGPDPADS